MILGRDREQRIVEEAITSLPRRGRAVVITGDPGIGKSTLAEFARQTAVEQDILILTATGIQAESNLPYSGLHQLLRPVRAGISDLPDPQADAILTAFGHFTGHVPDRFLVELAVTELLAAVAVRQPLLVLVDDAHWLDPPTCDALSFLGRRIESEPIVMLATARDGYQLPLLQAGLEELRLEGLDREAAGHLLDAVAPGLSAGARRDILEIALGNPLALTELSRSAMRADAPMAGPGFVAITDRIEKAFATRWSELPEQTRTVLFIAALDESCTLHETLQAAAAICGGTVTTDALVPAIDARLIEATSGRLRFRHPLLRSAIEYRAGPSQVTAAHQALATVLEGQPARRVWHLAAAALGPDEEVAAELDEAASRAVQRAANSVAITTLERAVELSQDPAARTGRLLRAAQLSFELGRAVLVERFVRSVPAADLSLTNRARLALLEESVNIKGKGSDRIRYLVGLARDVAGNGLGDLAQDLLFRAAQRCWEIDPGREVRLLVAETAVELADNPLHPTLQSVLAFAAQDAYGTMARDHLASLSHDTSLDAAQLTHLGIACTMLSAFDQARAMFAAAVPQLREQRRLGLLIQALLYDAWSAVLRCQWPDAVAAADEGIRAADEAGQPGWMAVLTVVKAAVAGLRGDHAELERLADQSESLVLSSGQGASVALVQIARGFSALGQGDYHAAYEYLLRIYDPTDPAYHHMLCWYYIGDLADAASHSGHKERGRELLAAAAAQELGPMLAATVPFATAMLTADDENASQRFELALAGDLRHWPFYYARLKLEYGSWLRRHHQPGRSREHLRTARGILDAVGAGDWGRRADEELRASGARPRAVAPPSGLPQLSPQELRIARMAAAGLSNREIGERLSVSPRTIGYHLYRMFPKLGVTSRAELGTVIAETASPDEAGSTVG